MTAEKNPLAGVRAYDAAEKLRGAPAPELDVDWLGIDPTGAIAVFLGGEETPVPAGADAKATSVVLERIAASVKARLDQAATQGGYRVAGDRQQEPIFDVPIGNALTDEPGQDRHERPFEGYPHLVFAAPSCEPIVRGLLVEMGGHEVLTRIGFAAAFDVLGPISFEELHMQHACIGCRVLDDPRDPRPRSPEALAGSGLYVYAWHPRGWARVVSPTAPADRDDLRDVGTAALAELPDRFETASSLPHRA